MCDLSMICSGEGLHAVLHSLDASDLDELQAGTLAGLNGEPLCCWFRHPMALEISPGFSNDVVTAES